MKTNIEILFLALFLSSSVSALADVHYVDVNSTNATPPYTNWATAATNIQDAVVAAVAGDEVVVTNGSYGPVYLGKPLIVRSVNGPQFTTISGGGSVRCVYLTSSASLTGFALTNGFAYDAGGGVWCQSADAVVSNCVIIGNLASASGNIFGGANANGGGAYGGTLNNCTLTGNSVGGVYDFDISSIGRGNYGGQGGGAAYCTLNNCKLSGNSATVEGFNIYAAHTLGGGAAYCTLNNCTLTGNSAFVEGFDIYYTSAQGGGAFACTLNNCTLTGNSVGTYILVPISIYEEGGGASGSTLNNCISFMNAPDGDGGSPGSLAGNNWLGDPLFMDYAGGNLRLQPKSPCINAGNNSYVTNATDLDGNPRISGGVVDIGAYEYQCPQLTLIPYGANVLLLWPTNNLGYDYTGFTVQSTTNLGSSAVWSTISPGPVVISEENIVFHPFTGPQQFYRLVQ